MERTLVILTESKGVAGDRRQIAGCSWDDQRELFSAGSLLDYSSFWVCF